MKILKSDNGRSYLDKFCNRLNPNDSIFIYCDLNLNWLYDKGTSLRYFRKSHNFKNEIKKPTCISQ